MAYAQKQSSFTKDGLVVETRTLTALEGSEKKITLAYTPYNFSQVILSLPCGSIQINGTDFEILSPNFLSWDDKALETLLEENDVLIISYLKA